MISLALDVKEEEEIRKTQKRCWLSRITQTQLHVVRDLLRDHLLPKIE